MRNFLQAESNLVSATRSLIKELGIKVSASSIKSHIDNHPDYPSILSISDSLKQWKIENFAINADKEKLNELPLPFIAHVKKQGGSFITITNITDNRVYYKNGKDGNKSVAEFLEEWSGVTLLAEAGENAGEKNYKQSRKKELLQSLKLPLVIILLILFAGYGAAYQYALGNHFTPYATLLLLKVIGCGVAALLLWYEIDKANPLLKKVCGLGKQTNCSAVLNSKQAKIFGVSWSEVGFFYFAGGFLSLLITGDKTSTIMPILAWLNVLALPYTFFSVYYQWKIAKQWCTMCLAVQALLVTEFVVALSTHELAQPINFLPPLSVNYHLSTLIPAFLLPAIAWFLLKPLLLQNQEAKRKKRELLKLKYDARIFEALLPKQKQLTENPIGLGITIGNLNASNTIIKVCNPYCGPCAKAHPEIDELLENNNDLKVQILFTATNDENNKANKPVKHLLAVAEKQDEQVTKHALDDWYMAEKKDYDVFAVKHPMNGELKQQDEKVEAMSEWCKETGIAFTPTFFINGYQLPDIYNIGDLKYFLQS